ncbi:HPr kinase/phosphorylase [Sphingomonas sp. R86521]|uniref:HPr kinase/phosphorylase n=1 Tax=Sphingomonas sp. R86521 TaxID=3093860 RepID=UPI0036D34D27
MHATAVAIGGRAVLIEGPSGAGKSDLALRLIDRGAALISDDQTLVVRSGKILVARAPTEIAGRIEVRGIGIVTMPHVDDVPVGLMVRLDRQVERMPDRRIRRVAGIEVRELHVDALHASTPIKIEMVLRCVEVIA